MQWTEFIDNYFKDISPPAASILGSTISGTVQIVIFLLGVGVVLLQLKKQYTANIKVQHDKIRSDIKIQIRNEVEEIIDALTNAEVTAGGFPNRLSNSIIIYQSSKKFGITPSPLPQRVPDFNQHNSNVMDGVIKLICTIERYEIAMPELKVFQTALNVFSEDFRRISAVYMEQLLTFLPFENSEEVKTKTGISAFDRPLPDDTKLGIIQAIGKDYQEILGDLGNWIFDLRVCIQNLAYGHLFPNNRAKIRKPIDPKYKVINPDDPRAIKDLMHHFENNTSWGENKKKIENEVKAALKGK